MTASVTTGVRERDDVKLRDREAEKALVGELTAFTELTETFPTPNGPDDPAINCDFILSTCPQAAKAVGGNCRRICLTVRRICPKETLSNPG